MGSTSEAVAAGEQLMQLDQAITLTLQEIDENFSQAHQIVTSRILPAIRRYESSCSQTWQSARFWKQFFEASAQVSLSQQPLEDLEEDVTEPSLHTSASVARDDTHATHDSDPMASPPRLSTSVYAHAQSSELETPFERLKRDVEASRLEDASRGQELPLRMADMSVATDPSVVVSDVPKSSSPAKSRRSCGRPRVSVASGASNPFASDAKWNGIADLRTTPLKARDESDTSLALPEGMSPPVTMQFSVPQSKYLKTPAKEAARRVVHDLLRSVGGGEDEMSVADASLRAPPSRRKSMVGTPLVKSATRRRDSLPTPPTITKVYDRPTTDDGVASRASLLLDAGEGMEESDDESDDEDDISHVFLPTNTSTSSQAPSRSIEDDTLFGLGARRTPASGETRDASRALSSAVRRSSDEMRLLGEI